MNSGLCIGCGICAALDDVYNIKIQFDKYGHLKPKGESKNLSHPTTVFSNVCPFSPYSKNEDELSIEQFAGLPRNSSIGNYLNNYVGCSIDENLRLNSSSGGLATWLSIELLHKGMVDGIIHVVPANKGETGNFFKYQISRTEEEVKQGAKSRYYPVELSKVLKAIKENPGRYAIVAIPCMIKGINLLRQQNQIFRERIVFTLGLFCGHMKSSHFVESIAWQMKVPFHEIKQIDYRYKQTNRPANWYTAQLKLKNGQTAQKDWWHLVDGDWGAGFFMNSACNFCDDVVAETADISFGDAWVEPYSSDGKGTNMVIVRSIFINNILLEGAKTGRLKLNEVAPELVEQTQAAGLRQRREGLSYRLGWIKKKVQPVKRVKPNSSKIENSRKRIYRLRYHISKWSNAIFFLAKFLRMPFIYFIWARIIAAFYYVSAYRKGSIREMSKRYMDFTR
jgi:coenzyme F420-reducing hydrogenase beta subunit